MGEIAEFPEYSRVTETVKQQIIEYTAEYPPYSDFNYTNILTWDLAERARVSRLHGNMVIRLPDYLTGSDFISFLGDNQAVETSETLLDAAEEHGGERILRLVPEVGVLALLGTERFMVSEDADGHDYVLSLPELLAESGPRYRHMRYEINHFSSRFKQKTVFDELDLRDVVTQQQMLQVFVGREQSKADNAHQNDAHNELIAMGRLFDLADLSQLSSHGLYIDDELKAFIVSERINDEWSTGHFWKADTTYRGIYRYLMKRVAERLTDEGCQKMNIEQDLGIPGLRRMKQLFHPSGQLKKYTVTDNN